MQNQAPLAPERPLQELLPREVSGVEADELAKEQLERSGEVRPEAVETAPVTSVAGTATVAAVPSSPIISKDPNFLNVERILEEDLGDLYASLPESAKPKFKLKGEQAATEISRMLVSLKVNVKRVLELIRDWLLVIPHANKFFLEQEAKIKTDKIVELIETRREELAQQP